MLKATENWINFCRGALVGVMLLEGVANPPQQADLEQLKDEFEKSVRQKYAGYSRQSLENLPNMQPYVDYYRRFDKTYHVLLQFDSVVNKGKSLPRVASLVEAMFLAEMKNHLLTAGHDADILQQPLMLSLADGSQKYIMMNGKEQTLKPGDMFVSDGLGVISSILHGPDRRSAIQPETRRALFVVYAPAGIGRQQVEAHLQDIEGYARLVSPPDVQVERCFVQA